MTTATDCISILVVEDEKLLRSNVTFTLADERKHKVVAVASAEEAVDVLARDEFNLVITDIRMGQMSGVELLTHIKEQYPGVGVIVMTAFGSESQRYEIMGRGGLHYLEKPFSLEFLLETVDAVVLEIGRKGFRATLDEVTLVDLIQLHCLNRATGCIVAKTSGNQGEIYLEDGLFLHASIPGVAGDAALLEMLEWHGGSCTFQRGMQAPTITIPHLRADQVLLDCLRVLDERQRDAALAGAKEEESAGSGGLDSNSIFSALSKFRVASEPDILGTAVATAEDIALRLGAMEGLEDLVISDEEGIMLVNANEAAGECRKTLAWIKKSAKKLTKPLKAGDPVLVEVVTPGRVFYMVRLEIGFLGCWTKKNISKMDLLAALDKCA